MSYNILKIKLAINMFTKLDWYNFNIICKIEIKILIILDGMKRVCVYYIIFFYQLATTVRVRVCRLSNYLLCVEDTFPSSKVGLIDDVSCLFDIIASKIKSNELNRNSPPAAHSRKNPARRTYSSYGTLRLKFRSFGASCLV